MNNKTAAESFSQNQPVAARGINNSLNRHSGARGDSFFADLRLRRGNPPAHCLLALFWSDKSNQIE